MAEWSKAAVLKTVDRKIRGFESLSLRHLLVRLEPHPQPLVPSPTSRLRDLRRRAQGFDVLR